VWQEPTRPWEGGPFFFQGNIRGLQKGAMQFLWIIKKNEHATVEKLSKVLILKKITIFMLEKERDQND